jgi:hypothetical protein
VLNPANAIKKPEVKKAEQAEEDDEENGDESG